MSTSDLSNETKPEILAKSRLVLYVEWMREVNAAA